MCVTVRITRFSGVHCPKKGGETIQTEKTGEDVFLAPNKKNREVPHEKKR